MAMLVEFQGPEIQFILNYYMYMSIGHGRVSGPRNTVHTKILNTAIVLEFQGPETQFTHKY